MLPQSRIPRRNPFAAYDLPPRSTLCRSEPQGLPNNSQLKPPPPLLCLFLPPTFFATMPLGFKLYVNIYIYIRPQRPLCPLLVRYGPPETDLCPAQSIPGHKPSRRAAAPHQPRRPAARASHRAGNKSVPRQSIASAKRISRVPIKFSKKPLPRAAVRLPTEVLLVMLCRRRQLGAWQRFDAIATFETLFSKVFSLWEVGFQVLVSLPT